MKGDSKKNNFRERTDRIGVVHEQYDRIVRGNIERMSTRHHRPKAPQLVRAALLEAAARLLQHGATVSIGSVAEEAGVSKGAVQHHFASRSGLFTALADELIASFDEDVKAEIRRDPMRAGAHARAYARVGARAAITEYEWSRAVICASVAERDVAARWRNWVQDDLAHDEGSEAAKIDMLLARLAADGLWLSDILGIYPLSPDIREKLLGRIEALTLPAQD